MPGFAPAPIYGKKLLSRTRAHKLLLIAILLLGVACEDAPPVERGGADLAQRHAELNGNYLGQIVAINVRDLVLLHPNSDRQRQARQRLLELKGLAGEDHTFENETVEENR